VVNRSTTVNVASKDYTQTYCIRKTDMSDREKALASEHEVLFRFGNWCYAGRVQLVPTMSLTDVPFVIPALRMQQSKLAFLCDTAHIPEGNEFAAALQYMQSLVPLIESQISESEGTLMSLIDRLTSMGVGESVSKWLDGDAVNSFFEFKVTPDDHLQRCTYVLTRTYIETACDMSLYL
jgi:hypothetical protein